MRFAALVSVCLLGILGVFGDAARGAVIASTDFDGREVSGTTASNLNWAVNGVSNPGNLTVMDVTSGLSQPLGLFNTANAQNLLAVDRNIAIAGNGEGFWYVDITLDVGAAPISLSSLSLDAYIFNNDGVFQPKNRDLDMTVAVYDSSDNLLATNTVLDIFVDNNLAPTIPQPKTFDLSSAPLLAAGSGYYVRITAFSNGVNGNNAGFDNLVIRGTLVPEPGAVAVWSLLGLCVLATRRRWHKR